MYKCVMIVPLVLIQVGMKDLDDSISVLERNYKKSGEGWLSITLYLKLPT